MGYTVYVLSSTIAKKSYVGFTANIEKRLKEHNNGLNSFTSRFKPWKLVYIEIVHTIAVAKGREKYLKSASGRRLILKNIFNK